MPPAVWAVPQGRRVDPSIAIGLQALADRVARAGAYHGESDHGDQRDERGQRGRREGAGVDQPLAPQYLPRGQSDQSEVTGRRGDDEREPVAAVQRADERLPRTTAAPKDRG
jgi:hypothetical protein